MTSKEFFFYWSNKYPLDVWFRKKFEIRFGSKEHLGTTLEEMYFEWLQEKEFSKIEKQHKRKAILKERYEENGILQPRQEKIPEDFFKNIDLSRFNDKK